MAQTPSDKTQPDKYCPAPRRLADVYGGVIFISLLFFLSFIGRFIFSPLMPTIAPDVGLSPSQIGTVFLLGSVGSLAGSLLSGLLSSRLQHRGTLILAVLLAAATLMSCYFAHSALFVRLAMVVLGLCAGLMQPSVTATVAAMVSREDWGKALSVQQTGARVSYAVAPLLAIGLLAAFTWQLSLVMIGAFVAVCGIAFALWGKAGGFAGTPPKPALMAAVLRQRAVWLMVLVFSLGIASQAGLYSMMPVYLTQERGFSTSAANTILGLASVAPIFTTFASGWLSDRFGEKRTLFSFMALTGAAAVVVGRLSGTGVVVGVFALLALAGGFFPPAFAALSRVVQPNLRNLVAGI
ncbi:MAG: MFS transporter, partial [Thermoleophilia bacterium]|nr:MFS transporter [Thermoleophilia bacterium]